MFKSDIISIFIKNKIISITFKIEISHFYDYSEPKQ